MSKLPSMQFYPGDWMKDPELRSVSLAARGLWIDMLCLMHEGVRRGYLQHVTGKTVTAEQLARMTGSSTDEITRLLQELEDSGVFSRTGDGTIFCRRMVRDEHKRSLCSAAGKRGGGNPTLTFKGDPKGEDKGKDKGDPKQNAKASSSSSSSKEEAKEETPPTPPAHPAYRVTPLRNGEYPSYSQFSQEWVPAGEVLEEFRAVTGREQARDRSSICQRITDGYSVEDLKQVVRVKFSDPYYRDNPEAVTPGNFFRTADIVEHAIGKAQHKKPKTEFLRRN